MEAQTFGPVGDRRVSSRRAAPLLLLYTLTASLHPTYHYALPLKSAFTLGSTEKLLRCVKTWASSPTNHVGIFWVPDSPYRAAWATRINREGGLIPTGPCEV